MIKNASEIPQRGIEIDLTGPEGNVFFLLGTAERLAKKLGFDADAITAEMEAKGDYDELVNVFDKYFGAFVTIYR